MVASQFIIHYLMQAMLFFIKLSPYKCTETEQKPFAICAERETTRYITIIMQPFQSIQLITNLLINSTPAENHWDLILYFHIHALANW